MSGEVFTRGIQGIQAGYSGYSGGTKGIQAAQIGVFSGELRRTQAARAPPLGHNNLLA